MINRDIAVGEILVVTDASTYLLSETAIRRRGARCTVIGKDPLRVEWYRGEKKITQVVSRRDLYEPLDDRGEQIAEEMRFAGLNQRVSGVPHPRERKNGKTGRAFDCEALINRRWERAVLAIGPEGFCFTALPIKVEGAQRALEDATALVLCKVTALRFV